MSNSLGMLIAFQFLVDVQAGAPLTFGGATIGEDFPQDKRGATMVAWGVGPCLVRPWDPLLADTY